MTKEAESVLIQLLAYDYLYEMNDGKWFVGMTMEVNESSCLELVAEGYVELSHGNQSYTAWKPSLRADRHTFIL